MTRQAMTIALCLLFTPGLALAGGDAAAGAELAVDCAECHGDKGEGMDDAPAIAGLDAAKHLAMLKGFMSGEIEGETMSMMLEGYSEEDLANLAAYYATLDKS